MKPFRSIFIIIVCSLLSGCGMSGSIYSNYRAIEELRLIQTLGCDAGENGGVTLSASTGKQGESGETLLLRRDGASILKAMDSLQDYTTQGQMFFGHVRYVVLGREAAERGIGELLDFAERDARMRLDAALFVLESGSAGDLIMSPGDDSYDITEVLGSVRQDVELRGISHVGNFRETAVALSEYGAALVCLLRPVDTEGSVKLEEPGLSAIPCGYGILKDGKLVGTITAPEAEGASLLLGYPGTVTRRVPDGRGGEISLQFDGAGGGVQPSWNADGSPGPVEVTLNVRAVVAETDGDSGIVLDSAYVDFLADELRQSLEIDLRNVLAQAQALDADFLAVGRELRLSGGSRFSALPSNWLTTLDFQVRVKAVVDHSYDLGDPVDTDGGERA